MSRSVTPTRVVLRPYADQDEAGVLELLDAALGGGPAGRRPAAFFRWKHLDNPFGRSYLLVADDGERLVGLRAFLRWQLEAGGAGIHAVRAVDTATHPDVQRTGLFSRLTRAALDELAGEADLVFNTPNDKSRPGYLKLGWQPVGRVPIALRVRRPLRLARGLRDPGRLGPRPPVDAQPAARLLAERPAALGRLLAAAATPEDPRLRTRRDLAFLRWRYGAAPLLDYRAVSVDRSGELAGVALFRVRPRAGAWEATVAEVLVADGDRRAAGRLLGAVAAAAPVDHLTCHLPAGSAAAAAARRRGFVRAPGGMTLVVKPLRDGIRPDPTRLGSWAVSLGDLEVF